MKKFVALVAIVWMENKESQTSKYNFHEIGFFFRENSKQFQCSNISVLMYKSKTNWSSCDHKCPCLFKHSMHFSLKLRLVWSTIRFGLGLRHKNWKHGSDFSRTTLASHVAAHFSHYFPIQWKLASNSLKQTFI